MRPPTKPTGSSRRQAARPRGIAITPPVSSKPASTELAGAGPVGARLASSKRRNPAAAKTPGTLATAKSPAAMAAKPPRKTPPMTRPEVGGFIQALAAQNPAPETELLFTDPFTLLVAVVLSAQATDVSVNRAGETLFRVAPTPAAMLALGVDGVASHIRSIGLWQTKARNVVQLSRELEEKHGGQVPHDREALEALPGVGRKTANVVLNVAFGEATMAVDTHIFRLGNRTGIAPGKTPRLVEDGLIKRIPPELLRHAHHWLILHGRYVCKARRPECWRCLAAAWCRYPQKTPPPVGAPSEATEATPQPVQAT